jgi:hypothetical protein
MKACTSLQQQLQVNEDLLTQVEKNHAQSFNNALLSGFNGSDGCLAT